MTTLLTTLQESIRYRGGTGHWAFQFHRLAGLGTLLFLFIHILDTSTVFFFPNLYVHAISLYRSPPFLLGEIALVAALIFHGLNGLKIITFDIKPKLWNIAREKQWTWIVFVSSFVLWLPAAYIMGNSLYVNSICQCPSAAVDTGGGRQVWVNVVILVTLAAATIMALYILFGGLTGSGGVAKTFDTRMWQFMRWSGVLLIPLAYGHVLIKDVLDGVHHIDLDYVSLYWSFLGWRVYDAALLGLAFAHGMNGVRHVFEDYIHDAGRQRLVNRVLLLAWLAVTSVGAIALVGGVRN